MASARTTRVLETPHPKLWWLTWLWLGLTLAIVINADGLQDRLEAIGNPVWAKPPAHRHRWPGARKQDEMTVRVRNDEVPCAPRLLLERLMELRPGSLKVEEQLLDFGRYY